MKHVLVSASALAMLTSAASAGGIDRSGQSVGILFEEGNYVELSFGSVNPDVSGVAVAGLGGFSSGDLSPSYSNVGVALKRAYGDKIEIALIMDQPFGADVAYPTGTGYYGAGAIAELRTTAITGILKYNTSDNFSVYGGLRYQTMKANAAVPFVAGYTADGASDAGIGYLVGGAYEKPEIAMRIALTYNSSIKHELNTVEAGPVPGTSITEINTPQSVNLDFQTGVAEDTLVFGSIRWAEWSEFDITPDGYALATGGASLVSYADDTISYSVGLGRRFTDALSGAISFGYEAQNGGFSSNLGPTDGYYSFGLGGSYQMDKVKITAGMRYVMIGDAQTTLGGGVAAANFNDNDALGFGLKIGYSF